MLFIASGEGHRRPYRQLQEAFTLSFPADSKDDRIREIGYQYYIMQCHAANPHTAPIDTGSNIFSSTPRQGVPIPNIPC